MRTTLNLDETLLREALQTTGLKTKTAAVEAGLRALLEQAARRRLASLGGKVPDADAPGRRRTP